MPGVRVCELMPRLAKQMHRLCVVRSLCTKDNAHSSGVDRIQRGDPKNRGVPYPHFGSAVAKLLGPGDVHLHVCLPPTDICTTPDFISTGIVALTRSVVLPSPIWPTSLHPQQCILPSRANEQV